MESRVQRQARQVNPRYCIGIDLGTSNCALAFVDGDCAQNRGQSAIIHSLEIPQLATLATSHRLPVLPSFLYFPNETESAEISDAAAKSERRFIVGSLAKDKSVANPGRVVHAAKSWLAHSGVDAHAALLPWQSSEISETDRLSPVDVSVEYLGYLKAVWERAHGISSGGAEAFSTQQVTITVPASFDASAQALTLEAAKRAGYPANVRLLEEPQSAFYAFLAAHSDTQSVLGYLVEILPGLKERSQKVLVCDVGGGTTDFSLFEIAVPQPRERLPRISRIAVSGHLLLGGDNLDLALAQLLGRKIKRDGGRMGERIWQQLVFQARGLKEKILGESGVEDAAEDEAFYFSVLSPGSSLMGAVSGSVTRGEVVQLVEEGFFPRCDFQALPKKTSPGLRELGLAFASDTAITRHLAEFLEGREVDAVLFNGGTLFPQIIRDRLLEQLSLWQGRVPVCLTGARMDLAVAQGAAYYGWVSRRPSGTIRGGYAHGIYVEIKNEADSGSASVLLCLLPKGFETGDHLKIDRTFRLVVGQPVQFQLFYSNRRQDPAGALVAFNARDFRALPALRTTVEKTGASDDNSFEVSLEASVSETGLLQLFCVPRAKPRSAKERWQLDFNLNPNPAVAQSSDPGVARQKLRTALDRIELLYGKKRRDELPQSPKSLRRDLERDLGQEMGEWNVGLLRSLLPALATGGRGRSAPHDWNWMYLTGFCLRPGFGAAGDAARVDALWPSFTHGPVFAQAPGHAAQWWILWRRIAGGLSAEQQSDVWKKIAGPIRNANAIPEMILLAGSLERLDGQSKTELGDILVRQLVRKKTTAVDQHLFALGRLSTRAPLNGESRCVLEPRAVAPWLESLLADGVIAEKNAGAFGLLLSQACRKTGHDATDVGEQLRSRALSWMKEHQISEDRQLPLERVVEENLNDKAKQFGEALPAGLRMVNDPSSLRATGVIGPKDCAWPISGQLAEPPVAEPPLSKLNADRAEDA